MNKTHFNLFTTLVLVCALIGVGSSAFADPGPGYGPRWRATEPGYEQGCGRGHDRCFGFQSMKSYSRLTDEDRKKLDQLRKAFWEATKGLKQDMRKLHFELKAELSGRKIDAQKAMTLQKKISDIRAQMDQKKLEHRIEVKEMFPDLDDRYGSSFHKSREAGRGYGGRCW